MTLEGIVPLILLSLSVQMVREQPNELLKLELKNKLSRLPARDMLDNCSRVTRPASEQ